MNRSRSETPFWAAYSSKIGFDLRQVEAGTGEMGMREGDLHGEVALGGARVHEALVVLPGEFLGGLAIRTVVDAGHG